MRDSLILILVPVFLVAVPFGVGLSQAYRPTEIEGHDIREVLPNTQLPLQKMRTGASQMVAVEASWFIFGSAKAESGPEARVYFSWPLGDESYTISSLPIERIRVRTDERDRPSIHFNLRPSCTGKVMEARRFETLQDGIDSCVAYATITCAVKDWQPSVQMPLK